MTIAAGDLRGSAQTFAPIPTHDGQGDVIFYDGFEGIFNRWSNASATGTGGVVSRSTATARNGQYSYRLTAGSTGDASAEISLEHGLRGVSRYGVEVSFLRDVSFDLLRILFRRYDGTNLTIFDVQVDIANDRLTYLDSAGGVAVIDDDITIALDIYHTLKMVVDLTTNTYERVTLNDERFELANPSAQVAASGVGPMLKLNIKNEGRDAENDIIDIDDVFITLNEPPN